MFKAKLPKINTQTKVIKTAKADVELKADGNKLYTQVEQIAECSPQLYVRRERSYGSSDSIILTFKDLGEMEKFADYIGELVDKVREQRALL